MLAGLLSFSSPCTLPLVPGYLGYMSGVSASRGRTLAAAALFVAGFAIVFTLLGAAATSVAELLAAHRVLLDRLAGAVIVALGLFLLGLVRLPVLMREGRPLLERVRPGPSGALFLGIAFAVGWTPCVGPILGAILLLASSTRTANQGALLLLVYSLGLGLPFLAAALFLDRFGAASAWLRRWAVPINGAGGLLLIGMGVLVFTERLQSLLAPALSLYARLGWPPI
ncbi:MAG TPA: cytochrome c biogenesis protein CcdA [Candidatus Dormibacteraeota bacterium]